MYQFGQKGDCGIVKQRTRALVERCLEAEMTPYREEQAAAAPSQPKNRRHGCSHKDN